LILAEIHVRC